MRNRLYQNYLNVVTEELMLKYQYDNVNEIPSIEKIVLNTSMKTSDFKVKMIPSFIVALTLITGQKASPTLAKKGNAKLGIRKNTVTGAKVTLRGEIMYNFLDLLSTIVLPRIKNFDGLNKKSLNNEGNFTFQINDPFVFPQLEAASEVFNHLGPITITITTTTQKKDQNLNLLRGLNLPLK